MTPSFIPGAINITGNPTSGGVLREGLVQANSSGVTVEINASDLVTAMSTGSVLLDSSGNITVSSAVSSPTANRDLSFKCAGSGIFETKTTGSISVDGQLDVDCDTITTANTLQTSRAGALLRLKSRTNITVGQTLQTNGGDIVLWSASAGSASGRISLGNNVCVNSNASCDETVSVATGNIYIGGGASGTDFPTGPATSSNATAAVRIGGDNNCLLYTSDAADE